MLQVQALRKPIRTVVRFRPVDGSFFDDMARVVSKVQTMNKILQSHIPSDLDPAAKLPGIRPLLSGRWLHTDDAYAGQLAYRRKLLSEKREDVLWQDAEAAPAVAELFEAALEQLNGCGFERRGRTLRCPDGFEIDLESDTPLAVLGQCAQEDICLMEKRGAQHVLTAAVLCFPASWTLAEKAGKPLSAIHRVVEEYDADLERRVQRLFDGVQSGRPLWRNNYLRYADAELHQPRRESDPQRHLSIRPDAPYMRAERQSVVRLPKTRGVIFSIHTYVARAKKSARVTAGEP